jgi:peptide deformylase
MRELINCFKKDNPLIQKRLREVSIEEGLKIATELFQILNERKDGIGLAANQVGIDARVAVLNVREPIILINPEIISKTNEIPYYEGCLSFPKKGCHTKRYETIEVTTAQEEGTLIFSGIQVDETGKGTWEDGKAKQNRELRTLEAVCVQHEIDHLNGMRILDRVVDTTIRSEGKIGRNHLVTIERNDTVKVLKYKKAEKLFKEGWVLK